MFCSWCTRPAHTPVEEVSFKESKVRTAADASLTADEALEMLKAGNERFVKDQGGTSGNSRDERSRRRNSLSTQGQNPAAIVLGCADSRCPIEVIFDAYPATSSFCGTPATPA